MTSSRNADAHAAPAPSFPFTAVLPRPRSLAAAPQGVRLLRLRQVLAIVPVSRSTWFAGIQAGRFPKGRHLGPRTTVWRSDEIEQLVFGVEGPTYG